MVWAIPRAMTKVVIMSFLFLCNKCITYFFIVIFLLFLVLAGDSGVSNKILEVLEEQLKILKDLRDPQITSERVVRDYLGHFRKVVNSQLKLLSIFFF